LGPNLTEKKNGVIWALDTEIQNSTIWKVFRKKMKMSPRRTTSLKILPKYLVDRARQKICADLWNGEFDAIKKEAKQISAFE
jgi:hypothetical protein